MELKTFTTTVLPRVVANAFNKLVEDNNVEIDATTYVRNVGTTGNLHSIKHYTVYTRNAQVTVALHSPNASINLWDKAGQINQASVKV